MSLAKTIYHSFNIHKLLVWIGGVALFLYALSGLAHPLMTWFITPQPINFMPPQFSVQADILKKIPVILTKNKVTKALLVKAVPSQNGAVLQVTDNPLSPRRYFSFETGKELVDYDKIQARYLAGYYTGFSPDKIKDVTFQTEFDNAYPWVNRLLPVYKVTYDTDDNRKIYIYTELSANAGMTNDYNSIMQFIFRNMHTLSFLDNFETGRVIISLILLFSLAGMCVTGFCMLYFVKKRNILCPKRKLHRLIANIVWFPLFLFVFSGTYHLLQSSFGENIRGLRLTDSFNIPAKMKDVTLSQDILKQNLNSISLLKMDNKLYYRFSLASKNDKGGADMSEHAGHNMPNKNMKYDGLPQEKGAIYISSDTGQQASLDDKKLSEFYASYYSKDKITHNNLITMFGSNYDFRNKRLPVREIIFDTGTRIFIDPATGILVDKINPASLYEGYSFSFLHKWNFLLAVTNRTVRDGIIVAFLTGIIGLGVLGFILKLRRKKRGVL